MHEWTYRGLPESASRGTWARMAVLENDVPFALVRDEKAALRLIEAMQIRQDTLLEIAERVRRVELARRN